MISIYSFSNNIANFLEEKNRRDREIERDEKCLLHRQSGEKTVGKQEKNWGHGDGNYTLYGKLNNKHICHCVPQRNSIKEFNF